MTSFSPCLQAFFTTRTEPFLATQSRTEPSEPEARAVALTVPAVATTTRAAAMSHPRLALIGR
jgi:hypothetical protein